MEEVEERRDDLDAGDTSRDVLEAAAASNGERERLRWLASMVVRFEGASAGDVARGIGWKEGSDLALMRPRWRPEYKLILIRSD